MTRNTIVVCVAAVCCVTPASSNAGAPPAVGPATPPAHTTPLNPHFDRHLARICRAARWLNPENSATPPVATVPAGTILGMLEEVEAQLLVSQGIVDAPIPVKAPADQKPLKAEAATKAREKMDALAQRLWSVNTACQHLRDGGLTKGDLGTLADLRSDSAALAARLPAIALTRLRLPHGFSHEAFVAQASKADKDAVGNEAELRSTGAESLVGAGSFEAIVVQGLVDFVLTRAKAEAVQLLQKQLSELLCGGTTSKFVPNLCVALKDLDAKMTLASAGAFLKAAALRDLRGLPTVTVLESKLGGDDKAAIWSVLYLAEKVALGAQPMVILRDLRNTAFPSGLTVTTVATAVGKVSALVSAIDQHALWAALRAPDYQPGSESWPYVEAMLLLALEDQSWNNQDIQTWGAWLRAQAPNAAKQYRLALDLVQNHDGKAGTKDVAAVGVSVAQFLLEAASSTPTLPSTAMPAFTKARAALAFAGRVISQEPADMAIAGLSFLEELGIASTVPVSVRGVLPFITEVASAKSSKDVVTALEASAAPPGSYATKYEHAGWYINAFVGGAYGNEWVRAPSIASSGAVGGVFAPLGLHGTLPLGANLHVGALLSVLDLGAPLAYRIGGDAKSTTGTTETTMKAAPNYGLAQLFSPGIFATIGLARLPIVVGFGGMLTPGLRAVESGAGSESASAFRVHAFAALDLTLFAL